MRLAQSSLVFALLAVCNCMLPPPVVVEQAELNAPPEVDYDRTFPAKSTLRVNINCTECVFNIQVDDPNETNKIYMRGFIGDTNQTFCGDEKQGVANVDREPLRCKFSPKDVWKDDPPETVKTFELLFTDRQFPSSADIQRRQLGVDENQNPAGSTYARWTVIGERRGLTCDDRENLGCK